ncbi:MAG: PAS domain S-box protein [Gemmatimonadales bacterium]
MPTPPVQPYALPPVQGPRARHVLAIVALAVGSDVVALWLVRWVVPSATGLLFDTLSLALATLIGAPLLWFVILRAFHRSALAERSQLEEALRAAREADAQYHTFVENTLEGIWVFGPDGKTRFVNTQMAAMLGYEPAALLGRTFFDFMDEEGRAFARLVATGRRGAGLAGRSDVRLRRADGADVWAAVSATPLPARADEGPSLVAFLTDITDRKRAEDEARRLAVAFDQAADAVCITDADGVIVWVNGAFERITGYARPEALGATPRILKSGTHEKSFYADLWATIKAGRVYRGMMINRRRDGELYFLDQTITPIVNDGGRITHFVAAGRAIAPGESAGTEARHPAT